MKIILPLHARPTHIAKVLAKILGVPHSIGCLANSPHPVDPTQPISKTNDWYLKFDSLPEYKQLFPDQVGTCVHLCTDLPTGEKIRWAMFTDTEKENGKYLFLDDDGAVNNVIGRRLVDFFGGAMGSNALDEIVKDTTNTNYDQWYAVDPQEAAFPPIEPGASADERWNQFQGALYGFSKLISDDVYMSSQMSQITGRPDGSESLYQYLLEQEAHDRSLELDERLPQAKARGFKPRL